MKFIIYFFFVLKEKRNIINRILSKIEEKKNRMNRSGRNMKYNLIYLII